MGRNRPDQLVSSLSKLLKSQKTSVLRLTFKRGGLWQPQFAKAHSRRAKIALKQELKTQALGQNQEQPWPLLVRLQTNEKEDNVKMGTECKPGRGTTVMQSLLGVFRVNFFKKKGEDEKKEEIKVATKQNANSKSTLKRKQKTLRNQERRKKRKQIKRIDRKAKRTAQIAK